MPKINQNAYEGRSATPQRAGVVSLDEIAAIADATADASLASPPPIGNTTPNTGSFTDLTVNGRLAVNGGAVTDPIGTGTLASGTVTIANTSIAATDRIYLQRIASNGSTTLGELSYTISAATSFTVTSLILGTPASTQTGDTSTFTYLIVRQV